MCYGRKTISPRCSLKIDLHKAFDSLHWAFISDVLTVIGLPRTFIKWVEACFTAARYSISFNGSLISFFKGDRGLKQGDPISPLLFVLSMNVLSRILNKAAQRGMFGFYPRCKKVGLTHLTFADDLLIFYKENDEPVVGVISVLDHFYEISGLKLNAQKCDFFTAGIYPTKIDEIKRIIGFNHGCLPVRYLGVPLVSRKLSDKDCVTLIDNIRDRLHKWSRRHLSYASRLELTKTVLLSITNFWCRQLILPQSVLNRIEQLCSRFFLERFRQGCNWCKSKLG
ncbi:uncharacterized protein LOC120179647 [Hibiscus syriacus]|uniref:uncharacterized protein LOC120179647 n=1 Tax=Hibiscus syriacus TaxID=106335 RepID=UPI0019218234|nr:uncharacterized protein LOC120179647 [Hibiscus syriacus]